MHYPNFNEEKKLRRRGFKIIVGLDESGRGPLAGPVTAAAVTIGPPKIKNLPRTEPKGLVRGQKSPKQSLRDATRQAKIKNTIKNLKLLEGIKDSKKLNPKQREKWYKILTSHSDIKWATSKVSEKIIDEVNILEATRLAMKKAVLNLSKKLGKMPNFLLIDGNQKLTKVKIPQKCVVKADEKVMSCVAASIISKVTRDRIMKGEHKKYPKYKFNQHKGYPTKQHRKLLKKHGPCEIHRRSFRPVAMLLKK